MWLPKGNDLQIKRQTSDTSLVLWLHKSQTQARDVQLLNSIHYQHTPIRQHEYIHGSVQIRLCQTRTKHTTCLPAGLVNAPAWLPISSETSPLGPMENPRRWVQDQTQRRGPWPMSRLADCCRVRLSCCCQRARVEGDTLKLSPFCLPKTPGGTVVKWPNNTHINKKMLDLKLLSHQGVTI